MQNMQGRTIVITGATSGIGQVAAESLASMGAQIVQIARDRARGEAALRRLQNLAPDRPHAVYYADLMEIGEIKRVASDIIHDWPRIDVLINNAGAMFGSRKVTKDGLERTFALNHLAYFVLTNCFLETLIASAPSRIINTASDAHESATLDFNDLQSKIAYRGNLWTWLRYGGPGFQVYGRSKLCNILFTRELARRLTSTGVTANCLHPGFVATRFGSQTGGLVSFGIRLAKRFALSPQEGAQTLIYLASSPDLNQITGQYFYQCRVIAPSSAAQDDAAAQRLWQESTTLAHLTK